MTIIKKGDIPVDELNSITSQLEERVECGTCGTIFEPDLEDFSFLSVLRRDTKFDLECKVNCPVCGKTHKVVIEGVEETSCMIIKRTVEKNE